uniref:Uncharacterized protein n=1 Tax=Bacillus cereus HuA4-10 TaxID=1053206 RepID=J8DP76_BACCE|nr:hypothetical protein IGC_03101 [Bacillus cereus HuA4-10]
MKPAATSNFTEELNGSIVLGKLLLHNGEKFSMMCEINIENDEVFLSSVVYYNEIEDEYIAIEDVVKKLELPLTIHINLTINEEPTTLIFSANKVDIYKNTIKTNLY